MHLAPSWLLFPVSLGHHLQRLPAPASLVWLWAPKTPTLSLKRGTDTTCLLATNFCREKIKLLTVLPFLSLYQVGTVLLTFPQGWLKVRPQIFLEKMKKKKVEVQRGQMLKMERSE